MEAVIFEGKEYVKASVVAEKFRYTQDYLGQLCRGKKVDARLVGRAWYLNLESLEQHRTGRYKAPAKSAEISSKKPINNYLSRIDVEPVLKNKTVKIFKEKKGALTELPVRYEQDEYSLIPKVNKSAVNVHIPVLPAEAERLKIKKEPKKFNITDFKAEALPEVFLSGKIKVDGMEEATESPEEDTSDITNKIKPELNSDLPPKRLVSVRQPMRKLPMGTHVDMRPAVSKPHAIVNSQPIAPQKVVVRVSKLKKTKERTVPLAAPVLVEQTNNAKTSKRSEMVRREIKFSPDVVIPQKINQKKVSGISDIALALVVFTLATVVSLVVLLTNREVLVEGGSSVDNLSFDTSNLSTFFASFLR